MSAMDWALRFSEIEDRLRKLERIFEKVDFMVEALCESVMEAMNRYDCEAETDDAVPRL